MAARRRRLAESGPPRRVIACASGLFAMYAGYHVVMFARYVLQS